MAKIWMLISGKKIAVTFLASSWGEILLPP